MSRLVMSVRIRISGEQYCGWKGDRNGSPPILLTNKTARAERPFSSFFSCRPLYTDGRVAQFGEAGTFLLACLLSCLPWANRQTDRHMDMLLAVYVSRPLAMHPLQCQPHL